jgi:Transmembrane secretion effector
MANLYVSAQDALPDWVRARGLAIFLTVIFGAMSVGSASWGQIADRRDSLDLALEAPDRRGN